jgi:3-deoxy-D-manno-octulosonate 8-phosphate phosphatase (KDO 8-P phosphatase)
MPAKKSKARKPRPAPAAWRKIRLFAMDVDGILTDGTLQVASDGTETKTFGITDGAGLYQLRMAGIATAWISGRASGATAVRAAELKIPHLIQGNNDKLAELKKLAARLNLAPAQIVYMGDDDIDAPAMRWAGIGATVPTALPPALAAAGIVTKHAAGRGAVREICDHILAAHAK